MNINDLKQERAKINDDTEVLLAKSGDPTEAEVNTILDNQKELKRLDKEIADAEKLEEVKALKVASRAAGNNGVERIDGQDREMGKISQEYRFTKVVASALKRASGDASPLNGVELEMHQEAEHESKGLPQGIQGTGVPAKFMEFQRKDLTAGSATSAGNTIATDLSSEFIPALRPTLVTQSLGARVFTGMSGNFDIARKTGETSMTWEGENDANAEGTPTTDKISVSPNRGGVTVDLSKQLIFQSNFSAERMVREDIEFAVAKGLDYAAISGLGSSNQPRGVLNTSGIGSVAMGTDGGAITYAKLVALKKAVAVDDALTGNLAFLTNPDVVAEMEVTPRQGSGVEGNFIKSVDSDRLLTYRMAQSTQIPNNLSKGAANGTLSALIFGNWSELYIFQWAGLDIVIDPYSKKTTAMVEITINSWWDVAVRHAQSFAAIKDLTTTSVS